MQGNPYVRCEKVQCRRDTDCHDTEKCDRAQQKCVPLCQDSPCTRGAQCDARNHREHCTCLPPLEGDGFVVCTQRKIMKQTTQLFCPFCQLSISICSYCIRGSRVQGWCWLQRAFLHPRALSESMPGFKPLCWKRGVLHPRPSVWREGHGLLLPSWLRVWR